MCKKFFWMLLLALGCAGTAWAGAKYSELDELKPVNNKGFDKARPNQLKRNIIKATVLYLPNRLLDLSDAFTLQLSVGAQGGAEVMVTEYFGFGGRYGKNFFFGSEVGRQYGGAQEQAGSFRFFCFNGNRGDMLHPWGTVREHVFEKSFGFGDYRQDPYRNGDADPWAIEVNAAFLFGVKVALHPVELGDFLAGIVFLDFKEDDL